jgi:phage terminase small subunit
MATGKVSARVKELSTAAAEKAVLNRAAVLEEYRRLVHSDIAGIMHPDGRVKLPHELDPVTRSAIASFKIDEYGRIEYKFWDKNSALERAAKILGLFKKDHDQRADALGDLLSGLSGKVLGKADGRSDT